MRGFQSRDQPLDSRQRLRSFERFGVGHRKIFGTPLIAQPSVLRPDQRIIQASRNRMRECHLAVGILQKIAVRALQHARRSSRKASGMRAKFTASATSLYADQSHASIADESVKHADSVAAAADAGED